LLGPSNCRATVTLMITQRSVAASTERDSVSEDRPPGQARHLNCSNLLAMSYRPHKRKRATTLKDITIAGNYVWNICICLCCRLNFKLIVLYAAIASDITRYFRPGILSEKLRVEILNFLCFSPDLISLPRGFLHGFTELNLGGCVLPDGLLSQVKPQSSMFDSIFCN
jgi:hypothetical protein